MVVWGIVAAMVVGAAVVWRQLLRLLGTEQKLDPGLGCLLAGTVILGLMVCAWVALALLSGTHFLTVAP